MVDGKFVGEDGKELRGSEAVSDLLRRCFLWSDIVLERYAPRTYPLPVTTNAALGKE